MNSEHLYKCYVNMLGEKEVTLKQLLILHGMLYILYAIVYYAKVYSHSSHLHDRSVTCNGDSSTGTSCSIERRSSGSGA